MKFSDHHDDVTRKTVYTLELTDEEFQQELLTQKDKLDLENFMKTGSKVRVCDYLYALALKTRRIAEMGD